MDLRRFIPNRRTDLDRAALDLREEVVYRILAKRRRRLLLVALDEHPDEVVSLTELAREVAAQDSVSIDSDTPEKEYNATYVALYQSHIPVLAEHDVVEWDSDRSVVGAGPSVPALVEVIRDIEERTR